jgi:hypothetical protein
MLLLSAWRRRAPSGLANGQLGGHLRVDDILAPGTPEAGRVVLESVADIVPPPPTRGSATRSRWGSPSAPRPPSAPRELAPRARSPRAGPGAGGRGRPALTVGDRGLPAGFGTLTVGKIGLPAGSGALTVGNLGLPVGSGTLTVGKLELPVGNWRLTVGKLRLPAGNLGVTVERSTSSTRPARAPTLPRVSETEPSMVRAARVAPR